MSKKIFVVQKPVDPIAVALEEFRLKGGKIEKCKTYKARKNERVIRVGVKN